jgi:hypothetical protein
MSGYKFWDLDRDGNWDSGEPAQNGWEIILRRSNGSEVARTWTDPNGFYKFWLDGQPSDDYRVEAVSVPGWVFTTPSARTVSVAYGVGNAEFANNNFGSYAQADVRKNLSIVNPPSDIHVSENVPITVRQVLHNDGPYGPVDVSDTLSASAPADCTIAPSSVDSPRQLQVSVDVAIDSPFTIHCYEPSTHTFDFSDSVSVTTPGVVDPNPDSNTASTTLTVNALAEVDVAVSQQFLDWPTDIDVSEDRLVTLEKTISTSVQPPATSAEITSVTVTVTKTASAPADCSVVPVGPITVPKVVPTTGSLVFNETFTIHCAEPSTHVFTFDNAVSAPSDAHITDPVSGNNSASTSLTVDAIDYADMKVVDQSVENPPAEIAISEDVLVVLDKVIHNNGPWGPVEVSTETIVTAPTGCTVRPEVHAQQPQLVAAPGPQRRGQHQRHRRRVYVRRQDRPDVPVSKRQTVRPS